MEKGGDPLYTKKVLIDLKKEVNELVLDQNQLKKTSTWPFLVGIIVFISSLLVVRFTLASYTSTINDENKVSENKASLTDIYEDQDLVTWISENAIQKNSGNIDLDKVHLWRQIIGYIKDLGEKKPLLIEAISELLASNLNDENSLESKHQDLFNVFEEIQTRLTREVDRLNNHSISNMLFGFILAFVLVCYNGYFALVNPIPKLELSSLSNLVLPKLLVVISLLTMFVYFMRLYKSNIADVKYYQNELTNIEVKLTSVRLALLSSERGILDTLIKDLSSTERNSLFGKEQTSLELERLKTENEIHKTFLSQVMDMFSGFKPKNP